MWKLFPVFLLVLAAPRLGAQGKEPPDAEQSRLVALENVWNEAEQNRDSAALNLLLAPDLVYVDDDGTLMDKAKFLASVQAPALHLERIVNESLNVRLYGAVAVVNGVYREILVKGGKPYTLRGRFTDTWIRRSGGWICVASHSTLIQH